MEDGQEINVKKFDDYYGDKAKIDGIHFQVIKDMETATRSSRPVTSMSATFPSLRSTPQEGSRRVQGRLHHG